MERSCILRANAFTKMSLATMDGKEKMTSTLSLPQPFVSDSIVASIMLWLYSGFLYNYIIMKLSPTEHLSHIWNTWN
jgi:hypothetical protein